MNRERVLQAQLQHPNIVRLRNCFQDPKFVYLVLDYAAGGDVYRVSKRRALCTAARRRYVGSLKRFDVASPPPKKNGPIHEESLTA